MAWIDVVIGAFIGTLAALVCYRLFARFPKITLLIIILAALLGVALSDYYITTSDHPWNIFHLIRHHFHTHAPQAAEVLNFSVSSVMAVMP